MCLLGFLLDIEDEALWHAAETEEDEDAGQGERYSVGSECLDRLAQARATPPRHPAAPSCCVRSQRVS